jgi:hypothetical protein
VTTDGQGTWVAVWDSTDSLGGTIGTDGDILVARSTDGGLTWTAGHTDGYRWKLHRQNALEPTR